MDLFLLTHRQHTDKVPSWMNALLLAQLLALKEVSCWFTASVPELCASTIAHVIVPFPLKTGAAVVVWWQVTRLARQIGAACIQSTLWGSTSERAATLNGRSTSAALSCRTESWCETVGATAMRKVGAEVTTLQVYPLCRSDSVRAATKGLGLTRTPRGTFIRGIGLLVWTAAVGRCVAAATFLGRTRGWCQAVWATTKGRRFAVATLEVRCRRGGEEIGTTTPSRFCAATKSLRSMCRHLRARTATMFRFITTFNNWGAFVTTTFILSILHLFSVVHGLQ